MSQLLFVEPAVSRPRPPRFPLPQVTVITPRRVLPIRAGGNALLGFSLRRGVLRRVDLLWINDPQLGVWALRCGQPTIYDVTDDWRTASAPWRVIRRIVLAEARLSAHAKTIVCSEVLRDRWAQRYGIDADVILNGIDAAAWSSPERRELPGRGPHVGYIGTLHDDRVNVELLLAISQDEAVGTLHLIGPVVLGLSSRRQLEAANGVIFHGSVPAPDVPSWACSMDLLICPHRVTQFTMSLDAIKGHEYLASGRPVVATPTSGFQRLRAPQLVVADTDGFVDAVSNFLKTPPSQVDRRAASWAERAREFYSAWPV